MVAKPALPENRTERDSTTAADALEWLPRTEAIQDQENKKWILIKGFQTGPEAEVSLNFRPAGIVVSDQNVKTVANTLRGV
ncbi:hypothetical protein TURU_033539 [Turdus rufiventris]|nr:hypothetical protein TURU_033539 [Turdus rufiventris]